MRENADRFEGLAETYALHRPGYPVEVFAQLAAACGSDRRLAVDVGAGPGNSTGALRAALPPDWLVAAVEPGRDMRRVLSRRFTGDPGVQVIDAAAEAMPLPAGSAGLVAACTAFHWFDREAFMAEAARILAPRGILALVRNRRQPHPLLADFDDYIARTSIEIDDYAQRERRKEPTVRELMAHGAFMGARSFTVAWSEERDCRSLIDLYLTRSTVWGIVRRIGLGPVIADLTALCQRHGEAASRIGWETTVKWVQRRP
jgi:SAM-dependent methyltransferase